MYRSMTVMTGQVRIPAVAALAASIPRREPNRLVFHVDEEFEVVEGEEEVSRSFATDMSVSRAIIAFAFAFAFAVISET